jgi:hypothetical protein
MRMRRTWQAAPRAAKFRAGRARPFAARSPGARAPRATEDALVPKNRAPYGARSVKKSPLETTDPPRNFSIPTEERVRAMTIGVPAWAARKRRIEDREEELVRALVEFHDALLERGGSPADALERMRDKARQLDLTRLERLVEAHNRYYPIEANLPFDPATGGFLARGRPWRPEPAPEVSAFVALAEAVIARR